MDKLTQYRNYVQQLINEYAKYRPAYGNILIITDLGVTYKSLFWKLKSAGFAASYHGSGSD